MLPYYWLMLVQDQSHVEVEVIEIFQLLQKHHALFLYVVESNISLQTYLNHYIHLYCTLKQELKIPDEDDHPREKTIF